jgi:formylglycine-generating enzyme required for sulfatase activity
MFEKAMVRGLLAVALSAYAVSVRAGVIRIAMVPVGDAGNAADPATGYGAVPYNYNIGKYDVTVGQYVAFLNSVATKSDSYGLYSPGMATDLPTIDIIQNGSAPNYSYAVTGTAPGAANMPVFDVSWGDAARFCNWLANGQPTSGTESTGTTETGSYNLSGATSITALMLVTRSSTATYFIPSENEWYKAAYYSGSGTNSAYYVFPTRSNTAPGNTLPDLGNNANFNLTDPTNYLTPISSFVLSPGPYGTYDMGGDVSQWNEANIGGSFRGLRGGSWDFGSLELASSSRNYDLVPPSFEHDYLGFRVAGSAAVPEPGSIALLFAGAVTFGIWGLRRIALE